jgi:hypothetical protein
VSDPLPAATSPDPQSLFPLCAVAAHEWGTKSAWDFHLGRRDLEDSKAKTTFPGGKQGAQRSWRRTEHVQAIDDQVVVRDRGGGEREVVVVPVAFTVIAALETMLPKVPVNICGKLLDLLGEIGHNLFQAVVEHAVRTLRSSG